MLPKLVAFKFWSHFGQRVDVSSLASGGHIVYDKRNIHMQWVVSESLILILRSQFKSGREKEVSLIKTFVLRQGVFFKY